MRRARRAIPASLSKQWLTLKKANTRAKVKTIARAKAAVRPVMPGARARTPAKAKEAAQPTEANRLKLSEEILAASL